MVDFGKMADKAKDWAGKNPDKADGYVDKGAEFVKGKTGNNDQVDQAGQKAKDYLRGSQGGEQGGQPGEQPPPPPQ